MPIVRHTFKIISDTFHKFAFAEQADLLRSLLGGFSYYLNPELIAENIHEDIPNQDVFELKDNLHHSRFH